MSQTSLRPRLSTPRTNSPSPPYKSKPVTILKRSSSSSLLLPHAFHPHHAQPSPPPTFPHAFASSPSLFAFSSPKCLQPTQGSNKEAKVVISVSVEGSPGAVRTMVKLGSSVEDTIKLVVDKYSEEGRTPKLHPNATSSLQLHHSSFSLHSLDKSELIGNVGGRSFYLRKTTNGAFAFNSFHSETRGNLAQQTSAQPISPPPFFLPSFVARKISEIVRIARRLCKILLCLQ